jgi:hypothetical protein
MLTRCAACLLALTACGGIGTRVEHAPNEVIAGDMSDGGEVDAGDLDAGAIDADAGPADAGPPYCRPCVTDGDCGGDNYCLMERGPDAGLFCGQACHESADCPGGGTGDAQCLRIQATAHSYRPIAQCIPYITGRCQ